jgi:iron complex outermembrane receptor protein
MQSIVYKYAERSSGGSYTVVDLKTVLSLQDFELSLTANNIFDTFYTETNLVPMPKANILAGIRYLF